VQAHKKLCDMYDEDALKLRQLVHKISVKNFDVKDAPCTGRTKMTTTNHLTDLMFNNREIIKNFNTSKSCVEKHLFVFHEKFVFHLQRKKRNNFLVHSIIYKKNCGAAYVGYQMLKQLGSSIAEHKNHICWSMSRSVITDYRFLNNKS